jgi:K+-transporting ATPase ATPase A chain
MGTADNGQPKQQTIVVGPLAAFVPMKQLGLNNNSNPSPTAVQWDIATALVILISRFLPIIAPIAMAASLGAKKSVPFGLGTLRDDTSTFGFLLCGTILIIGALLFLPVAALGPLAEHFGPIPFGG